MKVINLPHWQNRAYLYAAVGVIATIGLSGCQASSSSLTESIPASAQSATQDHWLPDQVRPLPGQLDRIPMFNSNSPEWIKQPGILLSTFPPAGKTTPQAHLNYGLKDDFTLFSHHFTHTPPDLKTLYLGLLVYNPNSESVKLTIPEAASYQLADSPFTQHPPLVDNPDGSIFSGPGVRAVDQVLRSHRQSDFPETLTIPAGQYRMLMNHPIPVKGLEKPINGRSTFLRLHSSGTVYLAELTMFAPQTELGVERKPTLSEWTQLLQTAGFAGPRDKQPTPPGQGGVLIYSRVAGIQDGSNWQAKLTDPGAETLSIPEPGHGISYVISTLQAGRLGTEQVQAAKLLVRYPDTAYEAHGNYAVYYNLSLPLLNPTPETQKVAITLATPIKSDTLNSKGLHFTVPSRTHPFFRGTIRLKTDENGKINTRYVHLWQRTGQKVDPIQTFTISPQSKLTLSVEFLYPPDSTPPQILRIATLP
jgi:hypothetical protein